MAARFSCAILPHSNWLLPHPLAYLRLVSTTFDSAQLDLDDFARLGLAIPCGVPKRQAEHLAGRCCAQYALHLLTGQAGVPSVNPDRSPSWPNGIVGAITHTQGWAAAIVARQQHWQALGLDAESALTCERADRLARQLFTPQEQQHYQQQSPNQRATLATLTFCAKESLFKALYPLVGQPFYFQDAQLLQYTTDGHFHMQLLADLSADWQQGCQISGQFAWHAERLLTLIAIPAP